METIETGQVQFDSEGIAVNEGVVTVYNTNKNNEFIGESEEFINEGVGLPAYAYWDPPPEIPPSCIALRVNNKWTVIEDHRERIIYSTETKEAKTIVELGSIPPGYTLLEPKEFFIWNGKKWVFDPALEKAALINDAQTKKNQLINEVLLEIEILNDGASLGLATNQELTQLDALKKYRFLLNRVEPDKAPDIIWPELI